MMGNMDSRTDIKEEDMEFAGAGEQAGVMEGEAAALPTHIIVAPY